VTLTYTAVRTDQRAIRGVAQALTLYHFRAPLSTLSTAYGEDGLLDAQAELDSDALDLALASDTSSGQTMQSYIKVLGVSRVVGNLAFRHIGHVNPELVSVDNSDYVDWLNRMLTTYDGSCTSRSTFFVCLHFALLWMPF
jgi:hypothetical protein